MSGGGKVPNAPDLNGNVANANDAYKTATSDASQTMNTAKAYNDNAQNTLSQVNGASTPMMQKVNQTSSNNLDSYNNTFMPLQAQQAQQAKDYTSDDNTSRLQGMAVADQNQALQSSLSNQRAALASEGVDPASVHGGALQQQAAVQGAANNAAAANNSYLNTQNTGRQLVQQANQLGLQVGQQGTAGAQAGSQIGAQQVANSNQTNATGVNNLTAANTYLNTGVGANKSASDISSQAFQNQMAQQQAQAAQNSSTLSSVGAIAGAASMFMDGGGAVPTGLPMPGAQPFMGATAAAPVGATGLPMPGAPPMIAPPSAPQMVTQGGSGNGALAGLASAMGTANNVHAAQQQMQAYQAQQAAQPPPPAGNAGHGLMSFLSGMAGGGAVMPAQMNQPAAFSAGGTMPRQLPGNYDRGGVVSGQGALPVAPSGMHPTDTKPAMLTPGEFVIPHDVATWKGHEYWYKQMDKARADRAEAHGLPPPVPASMSMKAH